MTVTELQRYIQKTARKKIEIPKQRLDEPDETYRIKVNALKEINALEEIEAESDPVRKRQMQYLFDRGIVNFSDV